MTHDEARQVIQSLARGIDPETGELLPPENPIHGPNVIRALFMAAEALSTRSAKQSTETPAQAGKPWDDEEDKRLGTAFDGGAAVTDLAREHQRSRGAITSRLVRLGRIEASSAPPVRDRPSA